MYINVWCYSGIGVVAKLLKMQMLSDDDELEYAATKM